MSSKRIMLLGFAIVLGLMGVFSFFWLLGSPSIAHADPVNRYVTVEGEDDDNDCTDSRVWRGPSETFFGLPNGLLHKF